MGFQLRALAAETGGQNSAEQDARDQRLRLNGQAARPVPALGSVKQGKASALQAAAAEPHARCRAQPVAIAPTVANRQRVRVRGRGRRRRRCRSHEAPRGDVLVRRGRRRSAGSVQVPAAAISERTRAPRAPVAMWSETIMRAKPVGINHVALGSGTSRRRSSSTAASSSSRCADRAGRMAFVDIGDQFVALAEGGGKAPDDTATSASSSTTRRGALEAAREAGAVSSSGSETRGAITSRWSPTRTSSSRRRRRSSGMGLEGSTRQAGSRGAHQGPWLSPRSAPGCPTTPGDDAAFRGSGQRKSSPHRVSSIGSSNSPSGPRCAPGWPRPAVRSSGSRTRASAGRFKRKGLRASGRVCCPPSAVAASGRASSRRPPSTSSSTAPSTRIDRPGRRAGRTGLRPAARVRGRTERAVLGTGGGLGGSRERRAVRRGLGRPVARGARSRTRSSSFTTPPSATCRTTTRMRSSSRTGSRRRSKSRARPRPERSRPRARPAGCFACLPPTGGARAANEMTGTAPEFRRRGLARLAKEATIGWAAEASPDSRHLQRHNECGHARAERAPRLPPIRAPDQRRERRLDGGHPGRIDPSRVAITESATSALVVP